MKIICYHGTNARNAKSILREGFREGTYFAFCLGDALAFGGRHVFRVLFDLPWEINFPEEWQFWTEAPVPASQIVEYVRYRQPVRLYFNQALNDSAFEECAEGAE